jgi:hypothetical protein
MVELIRFLRRVKETSNQASEQWPIGSQEEQELLRHWAAYRPRMLEGLQNLQIANRLAHVLVHQAQEAERNYLAAGMCATDARERAINECLLMEPETAEQGFELPSQFAGETAVQSQTPERPSSQHVPLRPCAELPARPTRQDRHSHAPNIAAPERVARYQTTPAL